MLPSAFLFVFMITFMVFEFFVWREIWFYYFDFAALLYKKKCYFWKATFDLTSCIDETRNSDWSKWSICGYFKETSPFQKSLVTMVIQGCSKWQPSSIINLEKRKILLNFIYLIATIWPSDQLQFPYLIPLIFLFILLLLFRMWSA